MQVDFLKNVSALAISRKNAASFVLQNRDLIPVLFHVSADVSRLDAVSAAYVLEQVFVINIDLLCHYFDAFFDVLFVKRNSSAERAFCKIISLFAKKEKLWLDSLEPNRKELLINYCFEILISDTKVANKCYVIRALMAFSVTEKHILTDLKALVENQSYQQSAAFKVVAREVSLL